MKTRVLLVAMSIFLPAIAFADGGYSTVQGTLIDQRAENGYLGIQSPSQGFFAFDEANFSSELRSKISACVNRETAATYIDRGMTDQLVDISCN